MTPAEELRAAAALLRDRLVSAATEGPWHVTEYDVYTQQSYDFEAGLGTAPGRVDVVGHGYEGGGFDRLCDAQYVAAMHPGVGAALADWLDAASAHVRAGYVCCDSGADRCYESATPQALAVARTILGSQP
ncbi:hypothetical protein ABT024_07040 [Streptomyces sp. NPDC002812]|uniref:hypothetical protein n=1 Tax=Streptomyces sp. NPDC002812 TaxID=3154434 RepID=UPI00331E3989